MDKELASLIERARGIKMTAAEYRAQMMSFVRSTVSNHLDEDTLREQLHLPSRLEERALAALREGSTVQLPVRDGCDCLRITDRSGTISEEFFTRQAPSGTGASTTLGGSTFTQHLPGGPSAGDAPGDADGTQG